MSHIQPADPVQAALAVNQQQQAMRAAVVAEIHATAREIYGRMTANYLASLGAGESPDPVTLRSFATEAKECAPYLIEAYGLGKVQNPPGAIKAR